MSGLNANIKLRRALASDWKGVNPILLAGEPGMELDTFKLKIGNGILNWNELPYIDGGAGSTLIYNAIKVVEELPATGEEQSFYKVSSDQKIYYWDENNSKFICLNFEMPELPDVTDNDTNNMMVVEELPETGEDLYLYKIASTQKLYYWDNVNGVFICLNVEIPEIPEFVDTNTNNVVLVDELPEVGEDIYFYKVNATQKMYYWDSVNAVFVDLIPEIEIPEFIDTNTDNIVICEELPEVGAENLLYKLPNQTFHFWNTLTGAFAPLMPEVVTPENPEQPEEPVIPPVEVKGGIEVVETIDDLPLIGESDMLYKVLADEKVYTWNVSTASYAAIESAGEAKTSVIVVENFEALPEEGENDILYKINTTQVLYMWNDIKKIYEQLGQGNGPSTDDGYSITLQSTIDRIFAVREGDPVELKFRYSSVDPDGLTDGPGIGTLIVNEVKKATVAIPQGLNILDISKYLVPGENTVQLNVENSEGESKPLNY
jgi:hypothetical protein